MIYSERVISSSSKLPALVEGALIELPDDALLLDVGAGDGRLDTALCDWPGVHVVGVEYDQNLALDSRPCSSPGKLVVGDARVLPFKDKAFEAVTAINTLHEVINDNDETERLAQLNSAVAGLARVLKPDGSLIIYDGLMPDSEEEPLLIRPTNNEAANLLERFGNEYTARPTSIDELDKECSLYGSNMGSIATFLTKYDYLRDGTAWEGERQQLYAFTSLKGILSAIAANGLETTELQFPEASTRKALERLLANYVIFKESNGERYTTESFPACQMLITARKI